MTGTVPAWLTNHVFWSEKGHYRLQLMNNSIAALLDTAVPNLDHSHEYNVYDLNIFCSAGQQGVVLNSGVNLGGCQLWLHGNMASLPSGLTPATAGLAALSVNGNDGPQSGSPPTDYSRLFESEIIMKVEGNKGDGANKTYPYGVQFGASGNAIKQCHGLISHSLTASVLNGGECSFSGMIGGGDTGLSQAFTGPPGSNTTITTQPPFPGLGTPQQNYGPDMMVYVAGGTLTGILINGVSTGQTSGAFYVAAGGSIEVDGSAAPRTYAWVPVLASTT